MSDPHLDSINDYEMARSRRMAEVYIIFVLARSTQLTYPTEKNCDPYGDCNWIILVE